MKYICNPCNLEYKYQVFRYFGKTSVFREMGDPTIIYFKDVWFLFASCCRGFFVSEDMFKWEYYPYQKDIDENDYAPDVRVVGEYMYFSASKDPGTLSPVYRSPDPRTTPFEKVSEEISAWDPNMFCDDDGRVYYYCGCSNNKPIQVVELLPPDMTPVGEPVPLFMNQKEICGYERIGENHDESPKRLIEKLLGKNPMLEGSWMTKYKGKYYLQYATPGTEYNIYCDAVYESGSPTGPFVRAQNNPFSYKPGGFTKGAGHGSTFADRYGNWYHAATVRISVTHMFERRIGIWPAGFDEDGELFCNQRFGDWVMPLPEKQTDPWKEPDWMLLSVGKKMTSSSFEKGHEPQHACDENMETWWRAGTNGPGEWLEIDLGTEMDVHAVQINFADDGIRPDRSKKKKMHGSNPFLLRYIDEEKQATRWLLEYSMDRRSYLTMEDKRAVSTDLPHDLVVSEEGVKARYLRLSGISCPYGQKAAVSGLRVFGRAKKELPEAARIVKAEKTADCDMRVVFEGDPSCLGYNILWGHAADKLYHCLTVYGNTQEQMIRALVKDENYYVRIDSFNEAGISHGETRKVQ